MRDILTMIKLQLTKRKTEYITDMNEWIFKDLKHENFKFSVFIFKLIKISLSS